MWVFKRSPLSIYIFSWEEIRKRSKRKVQGVPQSQTAALPRHQEEEEREAQIEQTYEKHQDKISLFIAR